MKIFKKVLLVSVAVILATAVSSYLYFKHKFTPAPSEFVVSKDSFNVQFEWLGSEGANQYEAHNAILLPVKLPLCPRKFFVQFDLGSPISMFYQQKILDMNSKYNNLNIQTGKNGSVLLQCTFELGNTPVTIKKLKVRPYSSAGISWDDTSKIEIIGTIGSDLIENRVITINYPAQIITIARNMPDSLAYSTQMQDFKWEARRILLPCSINQQKKYIFFDTGSSAFELITNKSTWQKLAAPGAKEDRFGVNSWGKTLNVHQIKANGSIGFGTSTFRLSKITFIEGSSFFQKAMMAINGIGGLTGNKLFLNTVLVIDTRNKKFGIWPK